MTDSTLVWNWNTDTWKVLDCYFRQEKILVSHQIESFDNLMKDIIPNIIGKNNPLIIAEGYRRETNDFEKKHELTIKNMFFELPIIREISGDVRALYPNEARIRKLTYESQMYIDIEQKLFINGREESKCIEEHIPFIKMPVMLHSSFCHLSEKSPATIADFGESEFDIGGYFIVNGTEKVVIAQERVAENQVFVWPPRKKTIGKYSHEAEIKSSIDQRYYPVKTIKVLLTKEPTKKDIEKAMNKKDKTIVGRKFYVKFPYVSDNDPIPLFIMFKALGIQTEKDSIEMIIGGVRSTNGGTGSSVGNSVGSSVGSADADHDEDVGNGGDDGEGRGGEDDTFKSVLNKQIELLKPSIDEARSFGVKSQMDAINYIAMYINVQHLNNLQNDPDVDIKKKAVMNLLEKEFLPHISQSGLDAKNKAYFMAYMTRRLIDSFTGVRPYDDRDHYKNKRVNLTGPLIAELFRANYIKLIREFKRTSFNILVSGNNCINQSISKKFQNCQIDTRIKYALSTGNWSTQKTTGGSVSNSKIGIAQVLSRLTAIGYYSHLRRIESPLENAGRKVIPPRRLHSSHFGMCCPNETPEGQQVGVVKNLSLQALITIHTNDYQFLMIAKNYMKLKDLFDVPISELESYTKIFMNGNIIGLVENENARNVYNTFKILKRHSIIVPYISIAWFIDWNEIVIQSDGGRYIRPLYILDQSKNELLIENYYNNNSTFRNLLNGKSHENGKNLQWIDMFSITTEYRNLKMSGNPVRPTLTNGSILEYLDSNELETSMIAMTAEDIKNNRQSNDLYLRYTHCEIHPMMMLGLVSTMIPFSDKNPSPRNCYQCLWSEHKIVMADGTHKKICDVSVGDKVLSVDPKSHKISKCVVVNQFVKEKDASKIFIKVETINGKWLMCTDDHPILTEKGWKIAKDLKKKDKIVCIKSVGVGVNDNSRYYDEFYQSEYEQDQNRLISDITIDNNNHSFIVADCNFVVHNSSMAKQAIGYYATNYNKRMDTMAHVLVYGHTPAVSTRTTKYTKIDRLPHGTQSMLCYACYTGFNQEDSVILNKDAVDRGFFNTIFSRSYRESEQIHKSSSLMSEKFAKPTEATTKEMKFGSYNAISENGHPILNRRVEGDDIIIGKIVVSNNEKEKNRDISIQVRHNESGVIDRVIPDPNSSFGSQENKIINIDSDGNNFISVRVSSLRKPIIGDKFACLTGDHDVLTTRGWKCIVDISVDDIVATLNPTNHNIEYNKVSETFKYDFKTNQDEMKIHTNTNANTNANANTNTNTNTNTTNEIDTNILFHINTNRVDLLTTVNHKMYIKSPKMTKYELCEAYKLYSTDIDAYTDTGTIRFLKSGNNCNDTISVKSDKINNFINSINFKSLYINADTLPFPEWIWNLNKRQCCLLLSLMCEEMSLSPATIPLSSSIFTIHKNNNQFIDDVQRLCLHAGYSADVVYKQNDNQEQFETVLLVINKTVNCPKVSKEQCSYVSVFNPIKVYCIEVQNHIFYVRRNGKCIWTGNSRSAQKGTNGMLYPQIDLPFNCYGLVPDIIMNPHGIPSRMTIGKLLETLLGKLAVASGQFQDATPFTPFNLDNVSSALEHYGFNKYGNEVMYNGQTGDMYPVTFYYGPTYYQRLKHMVDDKIHSRESGPRTLLTRQPVEGRSRDGGGRVGEMERDVFIAHGITKFLKERFMDSSDLFRVYVSKNDKTIIAGNSDKDIYKYEGKNLHRDEVAEVQLPFAMKLLLQEITSMLIDVQLDVNSQSESV